MKVGERVKLVHKDILCFGTAPKSKAHSNKVDAPFIVSVAFAPKGEEVSWSKYKFVKRTIHRPVTQAVKAREMDPTMQLLLSDMNGLNVSPDITFNEEDEMNEPVAKRKRSQEAASDDELNDEGGLRATEDRGGGNGDSPGRLSEETAKKRRLPEKMTRVYCEDVVDLPDTLTKMSLS